MQLLGQNLKQRIEKIFQTQTILTDYGIVVWQEPHLINVHVSAVAVVQLDQDVLVVVVGADHGAGVEVVELTAPVDADPPAKAQLGDCVRPHLHDLQRIRDKILYTHIVFLATVFTSPDQLSRNLDLRQ